MISTIPVRTQQVGLMPLQAGTLPAVQAAQTTGIDIGSISNLMLIMVVMVMMMKMMGTMTKSVGA